MSELKVIFSESTWRMQMVRSGDNCKTQLLSQIHRFFFSKETERKGFKKLSFNQMSLPIYQGYRTP